MLILTNFEFYIPEIFLTVNLLLLILYSVIYAKKSGSGFYKYKESIKNLSIINLTITLIILILFKFNITSDTFSSSGGLLMTNDLILTIKIIITLSSIVILKLSDNLEIYEYSILITMALIGMLIILSASDLIILYLGIELLSLTLYILSSINNKGELSTEAGLKYFIIGAVSSGILLIGCALIYSNTGLTGYIELENIFVYENTKNLGAIFILISMLLKLGSAPFHMWLPDVYDGSPTIITTYFAIVPKIAIFGALITLITGPFMALFDNYQNIIILSGTLSIIIGTLGALNQNKLKRLFAYSAISHIGFILIGLSTMSLNGLIATLIYFIFYIVMTLLTFTIILNIAPHSANPLNLLLGLSRINPLLALSLSLCLLSIAGVPPLVGFLTKFLIISSALQNSMWIVTVIAIIASMISAFYYLQLIKFMWFKDSPYLNIKLLSDVTTHITLPKLTLVSSTIISISTFIILTGLIYPKPWFALANLSFVGSLI